MHTDDLRFAANAKRAYEQSYSRGPWMLIMCLLCLMACLLIWAWWATVDFLEKQICRNSTFVDEWLADCCQWWIPGERPRHVVEANQ